MSRLRSSADASWNRNGEEEVSWDDAEDGAIVVVVILLIIVGGLDGGV